MTQVKKKVYSKNGCRECKRRKIKCDESKPECVQCSRLGKVCDYPKIGEKVLRVSKKYLLENPEYNQKPPEKRPKKEFILVKDRNSHYKLDSNLPPDGASLESSPKPPRGHQFAAPLSQTQSQNQPLHPQHPSQSTSSGSAAGSGSGSAPGSSSTSTSSSTSHLQSQKSGSAPYGHSYPPIENRVKGTNGFQYTPNIHQQSHIHPQPLPNPPGLYPPPPPYPLQSPISSQKYSQQYPPPHPQGPPPYAYPPHALPSQPYMQPYLQVPYPPPNYPTSGLNAIPFGPENNYPSDVNNGNPAVQGSTPNPGSMPVLSTYNNSLHGKFNHQNHKSVNSPPVTSPDAAQESTRNTSPVSKSTNSPNANGNASNSINNGNTSNPVIANGQASVNPASIPPTSNGNLNNNDDLIKNDILFENFFNKEDLNLLAGDLNNLVGTMMFESNFEKKNDIDVNSLDTSSIKHLISPPSIPSIKSMDSNINGRNNKNRNIPFDYIKLKTTQERYYLEQFYNEFAHIILPFNPYDESCGGYYNPARDVILMSASKEPFLLAAILAQGAKIAFNKNNLAQDEEFYCNYLSKCLKLLGPALSGSNDLKKRNNLASNIECVLLTVLLLTSANASNIKQDWRPHLRGAKDLLLKYALHSNNIVRESKVLIFCKTWFISFEVLAGLSSQKGGTLQNDNEIDSLMRLDESYEVEALKEIGMINSNGFNNMFGFYHGLLPSLKDLIKFLNKTRDSGLGSPDTFECIRLLSEFHQCTKVVFFNEKLYLKSSDFVNNVVPQGCLLDDVQTNGIILNWTDISQQAYCLAGMLTVLTKGFNLNYEHPKVKSITEKLINLMAIVNEVPSPKFIKCSALMVQWPILVGGLNCYTEEQKQIVQQFFRISGSGSASFSIQIIDKVWDRRQREDGDGNYESASDVEIDLVTY